MTAWVWWAFIRLLEFLLGLVWPVEGPVETLELKRGEIQHVRLNPSLSTWVRLWYLDAEDGEAARLHFWLYAHGDLLESRDHRGEPLRRGPVEIRLPPGPEWASIHARSGRVRLELSPAL